MFCFPASRLGFLACTLRRRICPTTPPRSRTIADIGKAKPVMGYVFEKETIADVQPDTIAIVRNASTTSVEKTMDPDERLGDIGRNGE